MRFFTALLSVCLFGCPEMPEALKCGPAEDGSGIICVPTDDPGEAVDMSMLMNAGTPTAQPAPYEQVVIDYEPGLSSCLVVSGRKVSEYAPDEIHAGVKIFGVVDVLYGAPVDILNSCPYTVTVNPGQFVKDDHEGKFYPEFFFYDAGVDLDPWDLHQLTVHWDPQLRDMKSGSGTFEWRHAKGIVNLVGHRRSSEPEISQMAIHAMGRATEPSCPVSVIYAYNKSTQTAVKDSTIQPLGSVVSLSAKNSYTPGSYGDIGFTPVEEWFWQMAEPKLSSYLGKGFKPSATDQYTTITLHTCGVYSVRLRVKNLHRYSCEDAYLTLHVPCDETLSD